MDQINKMTDSFFISSNQIKDLYTVRQVLEEAVVEWAVINGTDEQIEKLESIVNDSLIVAKEGEDLAGIANYDLRFHLCLAEMSKNAVANRIMHHLIDLLAKARLQSMQIPKRLEQSVQEHVLIVNAIRKRDIAEAKSAMRDHLDSVEKSITKNLDE